ncbi:MAG: FprA family A-type flavoprotein [Eubacteriales bacterium]|nr:FprA family A-type flavoprotein [Eubacteriales bacterium]
MHSTRKIRDDLIYVGGSDRRLSRFENLFPIPRGVSYNSYVLLDEKTVLFDTVDESIGRLFVENVTAALDGRTLDYLVIQHMEPDHCSLIDEMLRRYPQAKVVCSAKVVPMLVQFYGLDVKERALVVAEGDKLSTGVHTLHFMMAPMVHWPEVMVTYDEVHQILFSADAFGTFGALAGTLFDDEVGFDSVWMNDARRYYTNIVGKYGAQVQALLKKTASLDIEMICPLHGPVWRSQLALLLDKYRKWSTYEPEDRGVVIAYATMYGNTENTANVLATLLAERGIHPIAMYDVSGTDVSELVAESFRCSHLVLAAPTYNGGLHPRMDAFLADLKALGLQKRTVALIENGTWAPVSARHMRALLEGMKNMTVLENAVTVKSAPAAGQRATLEALADEIAAQIGG